MCFLFKVRQSRKSLGKSNNICFSPADSDVIFLYSSLPFYARLLPVTQPRKFLKFNPNCNFKGGYPKDNRLFLLLCKIKQRQLVRLRQFAEQSQICHKINDRLGRLGALPEVVLGQKLAVLCRLGNRNRSIVAHTVDRV